MSEITTILEELIVGDFFHRFSVGDTFDLHFSECRLTAHSIDFERRDELLEIILAKFSPANLTVDKNDISISVALAVFQRMNVTQLSVEKDGSLRLTFDCGFELIFPTDTKVVDWHWAITKSDTDPYLDYIVGAFEDGRVSHKSG